MERNPIPFALLKDEETERYESAPSVKQLDCSFYNDCLDTAIAAKWKNFGCKECRAYVALDAEQQTQDVLGLLAARMASENVVKMNNAGRTRGVKPGIDARTPTLGNCKKKVG